MYVLFLYHSWYLYACVWILQYSHYFLLSLVSFSNVPNQKQQQPHTFQQPTWKKQMRVITTPSNIIWNWKNGRSRPFNAWLVLVLPVRHWCFGVWWYWDTGHLDDTHKPYYWTIITHPWIPWPPLLGPLPVLPLYPATHSCLPDTRRHCFHYYVWISPM